MFSGLVAFRSVMRQKIGAEAHGRGKMLPSRRPESWGQGRVPLLKKKALSHKLIKL